MKGNTSCCDPCVKRPQILFEGLRMKRRQTELVKGWIKIRFVLVENVKNEQKWGSEEESEEMGMEGEISWGHMQPAVRPQQQETFTVRPRGSGFWQITLTSVFFLRDKWRWEDTVMARAQHIKEDRQQKKCPLIEPGWGWPQMTVLAATEWHYAATFLHTGVILIESHSKESRAPIKQLAGSRRLKVTVLVLAEPRSVWST